MLQGVERFYRQWVCLVLVLSLTGCVSVNMTEEKPPAGIVTLAISAHPLTNMDLSGRPSPTVIRIYQLRKEVDFNEASFFDLYDQDKVLLSADLLAREELVIAPGSFSTHSFTVNPETRFFAVMAGFQDTGNSIQKQIIPVSPLVDISLVAYLNGNSLSMAPNNQGAATQGAGSMTQGVSGVDINTEQYVPGSAASQGVKLEGDQVKVNPMGLKDCENAGLVDLLIKEGC